MRLLSPQLQAFLATASLGTVHGASNALHLTQTAITQRIKTLEQRLSTSLFIRSQQGMILTKEGEALLRYCHSFQELENEALSCIATAGTKKNITICFTGPMTIMRSRTIPCCIKIMKEFPRLLIHFNINDHENRIESLYNGESQFVIVEPHLISEEMAYKPLQPEQYVLVTAYAWKKRPLKNIIKNERIIDFDQQDQMTFNYLKTYGYFDMSNKDRYFINRTNILAHMIIEALGYGVLPLAFAKPYIKNKQLAVMNSGKTYAHLLSLVWFPRSQPSPYFKALIDACE